MGRRMLLIFAAKGLKKSVCLAKSAPSPLQDRRRVEEGDSQGVFFLCLLLKPEPPLC